MPFYPVVQCTKIPILRNLTLCIFSSLPSFFFSLCILLIDGERMEKSPSLFPPPRTFLRRQTTWPWKWIKSGCIGHGRSCFMCQQFCISLGRTMVGYGGLVKQWSEVVANTLYSTPNSFHHRLKSRFETTRVWIKIGRTQISWVLKRFPSTRVTEASCSKFFRVI